MLNRLRPNLFRLPPRLVAALAALVLAAAALTPAGLAADVADIGFIDQSALSNLPPFASANRKLQAIKADLDRQFGARIRNVKNQNDQARIAQEFQNKFAAQQRQLLAPLFQRAQISIASVASSKNLSVVVDKRIIIYGGQDVTRDVIDLFSGVGDPVPPVSTPPPSSVGYVDETQINQVEKVKKANDDFTKFQNDESNSAQSKMRAAKTDQERQQIFKDAQKALLDKRKELVDPVVDATRNAIADVARKKGLALVIDRSNLVYGGTDITSDVTNALK
jgi:Skp family chaperone for outer membrane proteins